MSNKQYTYRLKLILSGVVIWEVIFWILYYLAINAFGLFNSSYSGEKLIYKASDNLYLLLLVLPIIGVYIFNLLGNNKMAERANTSVMKSFLLPVSSMSSFLKYFFFRNAFVFLVIAMAQPVFGTKKVKGRSESLELVLALDISNSMNTRDISEELSRLEISKRAIKQLINNLHGEKIGICLFANSAFVQLPITQDYGAAKLFIDDIETNMISSQGTNINQALSTSIQMFSKEKTTKGIILITDGENHEEDLTEPLMTAFKKTNAQLCILGIGTKKGGLVPKNPKRPELGYKTNAVGRSVISKLNQRFIKDIAQKTGGHASISSDEFPNLSGLLTEINQMKRTKINTLEFDINQERYQIPLLISIIFWVAFILWSRQYVGFLDRLIKK
ncbi:MAG: VWA domain-containing protein [Crocinitomicaceae bacterium]|nr:VWA domain-containing protein [Crocinitomicaceae bacterium]